MNTEHVISPLRVFNTVTHVRHGGKTFGTLKVGWIYISMILETESIEQQPELLECLKLTANITPLMDVCVLILCVIYQIILALPY